MGELSASLSEPVTTTELAATLLTACAERGYFLACAESLTGGLLADALVSLPGASAVFLGSAVTYNLGAKQQLLGVDQGVLLAEGAVDPRVAAQMAEGAAKAYGATVFTPDGVRQVTDKLLTLSTTGVAGPDSDGYKPVGLVYIGLRLPGEATQVSQLHLTGDRSTIRRVAVQQALQLALTALKA